MNLPKPAIIPSRRPLLKAALIILIVASAGFIVGTVDGFRNGYRAGADAGRASVLEAAPAATLDALLASAAAKLSPEPDLREGRYIQHCGVTSVFLRNLGGTMRTFSFDRPTVVTRIACDDEGAGAECVRWTRPEGSVEQERVWDMDVVSFAYEPHDPGCTLTIH